MKALLLEAHAAPFRLVDLVQPRAEAGSVLVRIHASGVNPLDLKIRAGAAAHARHPLPAVLGLDLAGVVEAVGPGVTRFVPGDAVFGMTGGVGGIQGSLAEYAAVDEALLAPKPASLSMREAAALPLAVITAWEGLVDRAAMRPGQKILVHGGAGGVGHVAVQIALARGAEVFATHRGRHEAYLRSLGAVPIDTERAATRDYVREHTDGRGFDVVYDTVGDAALEASFEAVRRYGHVVSALGRGTHSLASLSLKGASYSGVFTLIPLLTGDRRAHHGTILAEAAELANAGKLRPRIDPRQFDTATIEDAYMAQADGSAEGKIVVSVA